MLSIRLASLSPTIEELMRVAGTAGLSVGVCCTDAEPYYANFGLRDVGRQLPVSEKTIFPACSLTKMFTAMAMALVVDDPDTNVTWDTPVKDILPELAIEDSKLRERMTVTDILAHRTGMSVPHVRLGSENNMLIALEDSMKFINDQVPVFPFRERWYYNNTGYQIAGLILDRVRGSWANVLREEFFRPFEMSRTFCRKPPDGTENVSKAYNTLDDGTPCEIPTVKSGDGTFGGASGGVFSCVENLLRAYVIIMGIYKDQVESGSTSTEGSPAMDACYLFSDRIPLPNPAGEATLASYTCGLARVTLPGAMGHIGINPGLVPGGKMPVVAKGVQPVTVLWHQGSMPGALAAAAMVPQLDTAVVVMSNTLALNDCADWVLQMVLEEILDSPERNDYPDLARLSFSTTLAWYPTTFKTLMQRRTLSAPPPSLSDYMGTYWNKQRYIKIAVFFKDDSLFWAVQGLESEIYELDHYEGDVFIWLKPRNYLVQRGRWVDQPPVYWTLRFHRDGSGRVESLNWVHEPRVPGGEDFFRG